MDTPPETRTVRASKSPRCVERAGHKIGDDTSLKTGNQIERCGTGERSQGIRASFAPREGRAARVDFLELRIAAQMIQHGGLDPAEAEIESVSFYFGFSEADGQRVSMYSQPVNDGSSRIAESEHSGDLVVGFAGGIVAGAAPTRAYKKPAGSRSFHAWSRDRERYVAARHDQADGSAAEGESGRRNRGLEQTRREHGLREDAPRRPVF